jgi:hypothetical protein
MDLKCLKRILIGNYSWELRIISNLIKAIPNHPNPINIIINFTSAKKEWIIAHISGNPSGSVNISKIKIFSIASHIGAMIARGINNKLIFLHIVPSLNLRAIINPRPKKIPP